MTAPKYEIPKQRIPFENNIKDEANVPEDVIGLITSHEAYKKIALALVKPLKGMKKRAWFDDHAYFCLPLSMGNQHGFIVEAAYDFSVFWNGGHLPTDVYVKSWCSKEEQSSQKIQAHFGMGTFTIQNHWIYRTPKGVNLLIMNPPNFFVDGIIHMTAIVETDQLRRDFTFNLKITRPNTWIFIKKGTPIGCILPYPRHYIDNFKIKIDEEVFNKEVIENERATSTLHGRERKEIDSKYPGGVGFRYMGGEDIYGNKFPDHQRSLGQKSSGCPFGFKNDKEVDINKLDVDS